MAETICRSLRDGALEGEHAAALTIKDSIYSPFGPIVFNHVLAQLSSFILAGKSQSRALVLITLSQSPSFYADLLKSNGIDVASSHKWLRVLDCYTDPLGWKDQLAESGSISSSSPSTSVSSSLCKDVKNLDRLFSSILELGKGVIGEEKCRFSVAIDSISEMLRHTSMASVARFLSNLRSHGEISSVFWSLHEDLHESKTSAALEYMSSMLATIEPMTQVANGLRESTENIPLTEQNFNRGKLNTRLKRRNGRVRVVCEEFSVDQSGIRFKSFSSEEAVAQSIVPKLQFNLQLSEKEKNDRAKVVLPFEHQGTGKSIEIYDGRKPLTDETLGVKPSNVEKVQTNVASGSGDIIYFRDSDDEMPDSDEDPDDDLDI
ncbi:Elongator complex protein 5 [Heracleum sosnowskyi]|uniref:Elongator complex protein 5 n=1 Tax=Heracleum sosnowskyi TaxID=360622 RepID=A0AAD8HAX7_9APIA|nr:Elongator complex protein 5 [Heracleum sosnowskyi]